MATFSDKTRQWLADAGWTEDRRIDTAEYERILQAEGYTVLPVVREFLSRFGGLHFANPAFSFRYIEFHFDPAEGVQHFSIENLPGVCEQIGSVACNIGQCGHGYMTLMMSASGKVYADYDDVYYVGESGEDAVEALCAGREFTEVPYDQPPEG